MSGEPLKLVGTDCPAAYVPPDAGEAIDADGGPGTICVSVEEVLGWLLASPP